MLSAEAAARSTRRTPPAVRRSAEPTLSPTAVKGGGS